MTDQAAIAMVVKEGVVEIDRLSSTRPVSREGDLVRD
jgi:hypothetical protein